MKKYAFILFLLSISNTFLQTVSLDIVGKWQLQILELDGDQVSAKEAFDTNNIFQIYSANNQFQSIVDDKINKGTWRISEDQKSVIINLSTKKEDKVLEITKLSSTELELHALKVDQELRFYYKKKM
jgi:hypothetical protein